MTAATPAICQAWGVEAWRDHRFGLSPERWRGLAGRGFWVTGAGTGYGRAISLCLALAGARVFATGRRSEHLDATARESERLGAAPGAVRPVPADITDPDSVAMAAEWMASDGGGISGLVNNAALPPPPAGAWPLQDTRVDQWRTLMATNVTGAWLATRAAMHMLRNAGAARVLFITSEAGWAATPGVGPYNVSKAALNSLAMSFAAEVSSRWPDLDTQINALIPGEARTEMNQGSTDSPFAIVSMTLLLLSHGPGGPNGRFFHRDGRHVAFGHAEPWPRPLA